MDENLKKELFFLMAKVIREEFPEIGESFIRRCEENSLLPSSIFSRNLSFTQLEQTTLSGIPNDQLYRLIQLACPKSKYPSLFFNPIDPFSNQSLPTNLSHKLKLPMHYLQNFQSRARVVGHFNAIYCVVVDATSSILITGSDDHTIKLWKIPQLVLMKTLPFHANVITDISIHPSNLCFATSSHDTTICIISLIDAKLVKRIQLSCEIHTVCYSPCGKYIGATCQDGYVRIWNTNDYNLIIEIPTISKESAAWLSFSPASEMVVFSADPHQLTVYSIKHRSMFHLEGHTQLPDFVVFSKITCKRILSLSSKEKDLKFWDTIKDPWDFKCDLHAINLNGVKQKLNKVCFNCDESMIIGLGSSTLFAWETDTQKLISKSTNQIFTEHAIILAPHPYIPEIVFVGCSPCRLSLWDVSKGEIVNALFTDDNLKPTECVWSPDGQQLFVADEGGGFTVFGNTKEPFFNMEQFFVQETLINTPYTEIPDDELIVDSNGELLIQQPTRYDIQSIRLGVKLPYVSEEKRIVEKRMISRWDSNHRTEVRPPVVPQNLSSEIEFEDDEGDDFIDFGSDKNDRDEGPNPYEEDSLITGRRIQKVMSFSPPPIKKRTASTSEDDSRKSYIFSRMSTRHTTSVYDIEEPLTSRAKRHVRKIDSDEDEDGELKDIVDENEKEYEYEYEYEEEEEAEEEEEEEEYEEEENDENESSRPLPIKREAKPVKSKSPPAKTKIKQENDKSKSSSSSKAQSPNKATTRPPTLTKAELKKQRELEKKILKEKERQENLVKQEKEWKRELVRLKKKYFMPLPSGFRVSNSAERIPKCFTSVDKTTFFFPQIGETVMYVKSAHKLYRKHTMTKVFEPPFKTISNLQNFVPVEVTEVIFYVTKLLVTIRFEKPVRRLFRVVIPVDEPQVQYLIPKVYFEIGMKQMFTVRVGKVIEYNHGSQELEGPAKHISDSWKVDPFQCLTIGFPNDDIETKISPWDIKLMKNDRGYMDKEMKEFCTQISTYLSKKLINSDECQEFVDIRNENESKLVKKLVRPMDLTLLSEKFQNYWYRTLAEVMIDLWQLKKTAYIAGVNRERTDEFIEMMEDAVESAGKRNHLTTPEYFVDVLYG